MGTCADMKISIAVAILIGLLAGTISTIGYAKIQPYLEKRFNFHDSCGILNLHGIPSVIGSLAGAGAAVASYRSDYGESLT